VSTEDGGALHRDQYTTEDGPVQPLDSVQIHFGRYVPKYHQPENWKILKGESWELLGSELNRPQLLALNTALQREGKIFFTGENLVEKRMLDRRGRESRDGILSTHSLTLIRPQNADFYTRTDDSGNTQSRTEFDFDSNHYDFPITDPKWRQRISDEDGEEFSSADDLDSNEDVLFTVSLGEEHEGHCYKIVAAVFSLDTEYIVDVDG